MILTKIKQKKCCYVNCMRILYKNLLNKKNNNNSHIYFSIFSFAIL